MFHREFIEMIMSFNILYKYVVNKIDYNSVYADKLKKENVSKSKDPAIMLEEKAFQFYEENEAFIKYYQKWYYNYKIRRN